MTDRTAEYLEELAQTLASHGSNLAALRMAELEQKVSPSPAWPGVPTRQVGSDIVATTLGNVAPYIEKMNLVVDPTLETLPSSDSLTGAERSLGGSSWYTKTVSGSYGASMPEIYLQNPRADTDAFSSDEYGYNTGAVTGAGTHEGQLRTRGNDVHGGSLPYIVGAIGLYNNLGLGNDTNVTARTVTVEVYNETTAAVVASRTIDANAACAAGSPTYRLWVAYQLAAGESAHHFQLRFRFTLVTTGATGSFKLNFGDPQLHHSYTPDPIAFAPILARWRPSFVIGHSGRFSIYSYYATDDIYPAYNVNKWGDTSWGAGSGAAVDTRLARSGAKTLTIDDTAAGAATLNVVGAIQNGGTQVVGARATGWGAPTGTATRTTFATDTVTLIELARRLKALIDDLTTHGLIGT